MQGFESVRIRQTLCSISSFRSNDECAMAHAITQCISVTRSFQRHEVLHLHECSVRTQHETYFIHILVATELFHPKSRGLLPSEDILLLLLPLPPPQHWSNSSIRPSLWHSRHSLCILSQGGDSNGPQFAGMLLMMLLISTSKRCRSACDDDLHQCRKAKEWKAQETVMKEMMYDQPYTYLILPGLLALPSSALAKIRNGYALINALPCRRSIVHLIQKLSRH